MMRIAIVGQPRDRLMFPMVTGASVGIVSWEIARRMATRHHITIYAPSANGQALEESGPGGVRFRRIPGVRRSLQKMIELAYDMGPATTPYFTTASFHRAYYRRVAALISSRGADVIHLQSFAQHAPLLRAANPAATLALHVHDESLAHLPPAAVAARLAPIDLVVGVSRFIVDGIRRRVGDAVSPRWQVVHNGVDLDRFRPGSAPRDRGPLRLLYVGRVSPEKGVHVLMEAFSRVAAQLPDVRLEIVGPAGLMPRGFVRLVSRDPEVPDLDRFYGRNLIEKIRRQIIGGRTSYLRELRRFRKADAMSRVDFTGAVSHDSLPAVYRRADVFVHPSVCNEQPMPVLEAMASGLPVVASRAGGIPEMVADGESGRLVPRNDPDALAAALLALLGDPDRRQSMGRAGRRRAEQLFSWDHAVDTLIESYRDRGEAAPD